MGIVFDLLVQQKKNSIFLIFSHFISKKLCPLLYHFYDLCVFKIIIINFTVEN